MKKYQDVTLSPCERAEDLLNEMTLAEKAAQMRSLWLFLDENGQHRYRDLEFTANTTTAWQESVKDGLGQITRPLGTHVVDAKKGVAALNIFQKYIVENTRLGIPVMSHEECLPGLMAKGGTLFPASINYSMSWDPDLMAEVAEVIGDELRMVGAYQGLAPVLDVARDARWGRTEETLGEDPYLVGIMASQYVKGIQQKDRSVLATLKHFAGHSASEGGRNHAPVNLGFREFNDTFLLPFEMAVKTANAGSVMPAYHDIDGIPCHADKSLLTDILREQWGFDGIIVADYGGVALLESHHKIATNKSEAIALAVNAGLDVELPDSVCSEYGIEDALNKGLLTMDVIDASVKRILTEKFRTGLFDNPYTDESKINLKSPKACDKALEMAQASIALVQNKNDILPLKKGENKIAVFGPVADDPLALFCGYSFPVHLIIAGLTDKNNFYANDVLTELKDEFGSDIIGFEKGCILLSERKINASVFPDENVQNQKPDPNATYVSKDESQIAAAVSLAQKSDVNIVCVGDLAGLFQTGTVGEGSDSDSFALPGVQQKLLEEIVATGKKTIVIMLSGRPYNLGAVQDKVDAIIMAYLPGQSGGKALANILAGNCEAEGRLTLSVPYNEGSAPYFYNHKLKSAGTPIAHHFVARFPFGHGLSYTKFDWTNMRFGKSEYAMNDEIMLSLDVENIGKRAGSDVLQVYIRDVSASVVLPIKQLKAFKKVKLNAKEKAHIQIEIPTDMLAFTGLDFKRIIEPGAFDIMLGRSAEDIFYTQRITLKGETRLQPKEWKMQSKVTVTKS